MERRKFLEMAGVLCGGVVLGGCAKTPDTTGAASSNAPVRPAGKTGIVYVGKSTDPAKAAAAAIAAAGGLSSIVKPGSKVVLKPNAAWARTPEQAATTDPRLITALVKMCKDAGASKVTVFEHTIDRPSQMVLAMSGITKAAEEAGADLVLASAETDFAPISIPRGKLLKSETIAQALLDADVVINVPKAKRHSQTELTLGMKNLMGVIWNRQGWHSGPDLHQYIADYATAAPIALTVIDASRVLLTNGPKGPGETKDPGEVIVSYDPVAADAYACGLFGMKPSDVPYIVMAGELGLGEHDLSKIKIQRV